MLDEQTFRVFPGVTKRPEAISLLKLGHSPKPFSGMAATSRQRLTMRFEEAIMSAHSSHSSAQAVDIV
ncbi:MAG: hypothetical protein JWO65_2503 [Sphingomonas bacterium]|nr:hypothetical protein [Sphingomonas bacterium]